MGNNERLRNWKSYRPEVHMRQRGREGGEGRRRESGVEGREKKRERDEQKGTVGTRFYVILLRTGY